MKNFFETIFPKKTKELPQEENKDKKELLNTEEEPLREEKTTKTFDDIISAKERITDLNKEKEFLISKHRSDIERLKTLGVNEKQSDTNKRSETFNEFLNPTEEEIKVIAEEISNLKKDYNLEEDRREVLKKRHDRLEKLDYILVKDFLSKIPNPRTEKTLLEILRPAINQQNLPDLTMETVSRYIYLIYNNSGSFVIDKDLLEDFKNNHHRIIVLLEKIESEWMNNLER